MGCNQEKYGVILARDSYMLALAAYSVHVLVNYYSDSRALGFLMVLDCFHERGLSTAVDRWSDEYMPCQFPLFDSLKPLAVHWMVFIYLIMGLGINRSLPLMLHKQ